MKTRNIAIIKIFQHVDGWLWQLLGPGGRLLANGVDIKERPQLALENAAIACSYAAGGPVTVPKCPPVGGSAEVHGFLHVWRQS